MEEHMLSIPLPAYTSPHLLNVLIQIVNKLGFKKKPLDLSILKTHDDRGIISGDSPTGKN
jgi:hypothetical protein